jgi:hypothetical protein
VIEDSHYNIKNKDNFEGVTIGIVDINSQLYKMNLQAVNGCLYANTTQK